MAACMKTGGGGAGGGGAGGGGGPVGSGSAARGDRLQAKVRGSTEQESDSLNYPDNVELRCSYPLHSWATRMFRKGILSDMGFYSLTYPDGKGMVQDVMHSLGWATITNYRNLHPFQPVFFWCHGYTAKEVTEWRQASRLSGLLFLSSLPNVVCLHNKKSLQKLIRQYEASVLTAGRDAPKNLQFPGDIRSYNSDMYLPKTLFDVTAEELRYIAEACFTKNTIWIAKPLSQNCGKGICLVRTKEQLLELECRLPNVIIQEYIRNPLLLDGRKSDMRVYLLLVCTEKGHLMAFYHPGFVRLSLRPYTSDTDDLAVHLTNQSVAKGTTEWSSKKDQSTWTPAEMNAHLNEKLGSGASPFPKDFVFQRLYPTMRTILGIVSRAAHPKLSRVPGCFEFLGCDFMLDTDGRVWLIEINCYPGMACSTSLLKRLKPQIVHEAICLVMECISKQYQGKPMYPIESMRHFQLLWNSAD